MKKYVGNIDFVNGFYNFFPLYEVDQNGELIYLDENEKNSLLDQSVFLNINLSYNQYDNTFIVEDYIHTDDLYVFEFTVKELELNITRNGEVNKTKYRYPVKQAIQSGKLYPISKIGRYKTITEEELDGDFRNANVVYINSDSYYENDEVLVRLNKEKVYVGPYRLKRRTYDGKINFSPRINANKFIATGYSLDDCRREVIDQILYAEFDSDSLSWRYWRIKKNAVPRNIDLISDEKLLEGFLEETKEKINSDDISQIIDDYVNSVFVGNIITEEISNNRKERLLALLSSKESLSSIVDLASSVIMQRISSAPDSDDINAFMDSLIDSHPELLDKIQNLRLIKEQVANAKQELEEIDNQKKQAHEEILNIDTLSIRQAQQHEDKTVSAEIEKKKAEFDELCKKLELVYDYDDIKHKIEAGKAEADYYEKHKNHLSNETYRMETQFVNMINGYSEKIASITFDGFISSKMLQAAAEWEDEATTSRFEHWVEVINNTECLNKDRDELIDYLVLKIQAVRPQYDKNMIINLMVCLTQGFLTVFAGLPGCGKTSICNLIGRVLGLNKIGSETQLIEARDNFRRFVGVSVERGWTSKRDFIGYYNPLTKSFEESNRAVYDALKMLDVENRKGITKYPFFILLDEANLSPMEYYWADFMNVCDDLDDNNQINIGNGVVLTVPETLHFVATINNDHTTETLSPRLIDRAWIISLPRPNNISQRTQILENEIDIISWDSLKTVFGVEREGNLALSPEIQKIYDAIKNELEKVDILISPRAELAIRRYWKTAASVMEEDEYGNSASIIALDYAIAQKVLPMINGSGDGYLEWLSGFKALLNRNNLRTSEDILNEIIERGNRQMKYYQFFN